jgi:hypothetical protein
MRPFLRLALLLLLPASAAAETWFIPAAAHAAGAEGTNWRTEAVLVNPGAVTLCADLYFLEAGRDNAAAEAHPLEVPSGCSVRVDDLVGAFLAAPGKAGAVRVEADGFLAITTRTFNDRGEAGTYGQGVPALTPESALGFGSSRLLFPLVRTPAYRTNIGLVNTGPQPVKMVAEFYLPEFLHDPVLIKIWELRPWEYLQVGDVMAPYSVERGYARVIVETPGGTVLPWVSIVDNRTGDPAFSPNADRTVLMAPEESEWVRVTGAAGDDLAHAVAAADDGGIWVAGESDSTETESINGVVMKIDAWGRVVAKQELFAAGQIKIFGLHALPGGGAVLCGAWTGPGSVFWSGWAMELSPRAQVWWSRIYSQTESAWLYGIVPMPDGTYRACGQIQPSDGSPADAWVMALDAGGGILWQNRLSGPMENWLYALAAVPGGGVAVAGGTQSFGSSDWDAWLVELDGEGKVVRENIYGGPGQEAVYGIGFLPGGDIVLSGQTDSWGSGGGDLWLVRTDAMGGFVWGRTLGTRDWETAFILAVDADGRILTGGQRGEITAGHGDGWLAEWDPDGNLLVQAVAGGDEPERLYGAAARPGGGWMAAGRTQSAGEGGKDLLLLSLPEGLVSRDACSFLSRPAGAPVETPPTATSVSSVATDSKAAASDWLRYLDGGTPWDDQVLCGGVHGGPFRSLVPAVARTAGSYGTEWRSDLFLRLPEDWGNSSVAARISFLRSGQDNPAPPSVQVTGFPGELVKVPDALAALYDEDEAYGALLVEADGPVEAWTDTYTRNGDGGSLGQGIPAFPEEACLKTGEAAVLPGLVRSPEFRSNVGFAGSGPAKTEIALEVHASDGTLLGTRTFDLPVSGHLQAGDFLAGFGDRLEGVWVVVRSGSAGACIFAYASVVDNRTGDPVFVPAVKVP